MKSSIDTVRELAGKNTSILRSASAAQEKIMHAAEAECARLSKLIDGVLHADVLTDDVKAEQYQAWVMERAKLMRLLSERHA